MAWIFNIRGGDVAHTPLPLGFALVPATGRPALYVDARKLDNAVRAALEALADMREPAAFVRRPERALGARARRCGSTRRPPPNAIVLAIEAAGGKVSRGPDPIAPMKAVKNATEIAGARAAHLRDGAAVTRFLAWFDREAPGGRLTEIDAVEALEGFPPRHRRCSRTSRSRPSRAPDRTAPSCTTASPRGRNRRIAPGELFLIDSGAQYEDGTTDITRTVAIGTPSEEMRERFTRVLKGHIAIARAVFPEGHHRGAARQLRARLAVERGARFRPRHRPRRRQLSVGARRAGAHLQARHRRRSSAA